MGNNKEIKGKTGLNDYTENQLAMYDFLNEVAIRINTGLVIERYLKTGENGLLEVNTEKLKEFE
ncbi:MAG: hypothetical protein JZU53_04670 [Paludibacter sp.]|nr:hypothetical protein [Paludibacter sp.]